MHKIPIFYFFIVFCVFIITEVTSLANSSCGQSSVSPRRVRRIVNGKYAENGEFPWQVNFGAIIGESIYLACNGVILTGKWVLTTAHCLREYRDGKYDDLIMEFGEISSFKKSDTRFLSKYVIHPHYEVDLFEFDVALVKLSEPIQFNTKIQPICLPLKGEDNEIAGKFGTVAGWGRLYNNESHSKVLLKADIPIIEYEICKKIMVPNKIFPPPLFSIPDERYIMCAGYRHNKIAICKGDSGGPLQMKRNDGTWYLVGLTTRYVEKCANPEVPVMLFTRVSSFVPWIRRVIYAD